MGTVDGPWVCESLETEKFYVCMHSFQETVK